MTTAKFAATVVFMALVTSGARAQLAAVSEEELRQSRYIVNGTVTSLSVLEIVPIAGCMSTALVTLVVERTAEARPADLPAAVAVRGEIEVRASDERCRRPGARGVRGLADVKKGSRIKVYAARAMSDGALEIIAPNGLVLLP